jgi:hypothetical protein
LAGNRGADGSQYAAGAAVDQEKGFPGAIKHCRPFLCFFEDSLWVVEVVKTFDFRNIYGIRIGECQGGPLMPRHMERIPVLAGIIQKALVQERGAGFLQRIKNLVRHG